MRRAPIDAMIEFALEELLSGTGGRRKSLLRKMCQKYPSEPALALAFALTNAASMIEDSFNHPNDSEAVGVLTYKLVALLSADIYAVQMMGKSPVLARDVEHFWRRADEDYLEL